MIESMTPDLQQAIQLFFADRIFSVSGPPVYRIGMDDIKKEFRKKAMLFHPDRAEMLGENKGTLEEKFKQISHAYGVLKSELDDEGLILRPNFFERSAASSKQSATFNGSSSRKSNAAPQKPAGRSSVRPNAFAGRDARLKNSHGKQFFFSGMVPKRKLRLGEYLFYRRVIAWSTLIDAIVWQHRVRPRLGQIALDLNYLEHQDIMEILKNKTFKEPFGRAAVRLGFLNDYNRFVLLGRQRGYNLPLGKFFLDFHVLNETALDRYIRENRVHNIHYHKLFQGV
ncbi:MAG: DnaJ domain-containing protein [Pseudomonadota bacterium]